MAFHNSSPENTHPKAQEKTEFFSTSKDFSPLTHNENSNTSLDLQDKGGMESQSSANL
jgi:hypothetical protein